MKMSKGIGLGALLVVVILLAVIIAPSINASVNKTKSEKALEHVSQKHGIPKEQLMITNEKEANFPLSNQKLWSVKILDPKTKESYYVNLDEAGNFTDIKTVKELEYTKYREKYGKKEIALHEKLQKMKPNNTVEVGIWLKPIKDDPKPEREISEKEYKEILDVKRKAYEQKDKPVLDILKAKNINVRYVSQYAPLIYAEVPVELMAEIENISEVDGIYLSREFKPSLDKVAQTVRVQPMWSAGNTGSGINVAVVEHGKINESHPNLPTVTVYNHSEVNSSHATQVAGIIATINNDTYKGIAYGVPGLMSANFGGGYPATEESRAIAASEWAINNSADILSNSWNNNTERVLSGIDKYFDHVVWSNYKTVIVSAGNDGETTGNVGSPGLGYNVITVGGFEDKGDSVWSNDVIWAGSNYKNPISDHGDREKPEVAAVATHGGSNYIITTSISRPPFGSPIESPEGAGTSYAAPAVAAEAALLMQSESWLKTSPEAVKAIIMASAVHNIEGDSRLSDKDGAGGIDILSAYNKTNASEMITFAIDYPKNITFSSSAGEKVRVVIVWDSHPDSNHPPVNDDLQSDLDLYIYDPSGALVNKSDSYDNSYEIVEFTAPATGTYNAQINAPTFDGLYEYVGIAKTALPSLSGWNYAKVKTIIGTTAGSQTNYQMKLTVYKGSGTDTPGVVYLGGNVNDNFSDLRFTKSDGVTLLDYWIESYTSGVSAVVWVEVDSIPASSGTADIYIYYGNPSATSASSGAATFLFFDDFSAGSSDLTEVDPNNKIEQDRTTDHRMEWNNINKQETAYVNKVLSIPNNFSVDFTWSNSYVWPGIIYPVGFGDSDSDLRGSGQGNGLGPAISGGEWARIEHTTAGSESTSGEVTIISSPTVYYGTFRRSGNTVTLYIYSNSARTTQISGSPVTYNDASITAYNRVFVFSSFNDGGIWRPGSSTGWCDDIRVRKYVSPEPAW